MPNQPGISAAQLRLLEELCAASAISGQEGEVRKIVKAQLEGHVDDMKVDALGNILATKTGKGRKSSRLRVMIAAHMDEVGLMITGDDKNGVYSFNTVGGLSASQLVGKTVIIGKDHIAGVIGFKPIHLTSASERSNSVSTDSLRIDTGGSGNGKVKIGDRVTFTPNFLKIGSGVTRTVRSKALDDRIGVATLIELIKHAPGNIDLLAAFTTQEEIGLRGAKVAAHAFDPDFAIALDCTPAYDLPHWDGEENTRYNSRLGDGPAIYLTDRGTLSDPRLIRHFTGAAEKHKIAFQYRQPGGGGTDAGAIHKARAGIPSLSLSVPGRYMHTASSIVRISDWQNTLRLLHAALTETRPALLKSDRA
jgi:endoglucanase